MKKIIWLSWEDHRRNHSLAHYIGADLYELGDTIRWARLLRYGSNIVKTIRIYSRQRPTTVICQNPSSVLALLTILLRWRFGYQVGLDTHNVGFALDPWLPWYLKKLAVWLQRQADFVITHNDELAAFVADRGGTVITLPDPLPAIRQGPPLPLPDRFNLLFVCTFKPDEPYGAVLEAVRRLDSDIGIYVTGTPPKRVENASWPDHVVFCGRVSWERYDQLLRSVNAVIDLTTREMCLLCGAYEAVAAGKPMLLSRTRTLMGYFRRGAVFTDNQADGSPHALRAAILELRARERELRREVEILRTELTQDWERRACHLQALLQ